MLLTCKSLKISIWITTLSIPCHSLAARQDDKVSLKSCNIIKPDLIIRAVIKSRVPGIFPGFYGCGPRLLLLESRRNIEPKQIPRWLIPCLLLMYFSQILCLGTFLICLCYLVFIEWSGLSKSFLACENICFSLLFAAGDVSRGGTSATQQQKFHTDDANQCLHNKSSSHGVPNTNLSNFTCLLVDFGKVLCSSANELQ